MSFAGVFSTKERAQKWVKADKVYWHKVMSNPIFEWEYSIIETEVDAERCPYVFDTADPDQDYCELAEGHDGEHLCACGWRPDYRDEDQDPGHGSTTEGREK
jgi:hypothetical protein